MTEQPTEDSKTSTPDEGVLVVSEDDPPPPRWRPAAEPTCCGSGCLDCPF